MKVRLSHSRRVAVSELLSVADLCKHNPKTVQVVLARCEDLIHGKRGGWELSDDTIEQVYAELKQYV